MDGRAVILPGKSRYVFFLLPFGKVEERVFTLTPDNEVEFFLFDGPLRVQRSMRPTHDNFNTWVQLPDQTCDDLGRPVVGCQHQDTDNVRLVRLDGLFYFGPDGMGEIVKRGFIHGEAIENLPLVGVGSVVQVIGIVYFSFVTVLSQDGGDGGNPQMETVEVAAHQPVKRRSYHEYPLHYEPPSRTLAPVCFWRLRLLFS